MKMPYLKFYVRDHISEPCLRMCSLTARGLWTEMLCMMHMATPYGHLVDAIGRKLGLVDLARMVAEDATIVEEAYYELARNDVFSVNEAGVVYSRRMVADAELSSKRGRAGKIGMSNRYGVDFSGDTGATCTTGVTGNTDIPV